MRELIQRAKLTPPYISIVIPVYNVEDYLRRTLDSVVYQTLQEIEIIVVNDCSPDNSQAIIDEYARRYPDKIIPLKHEKNQGLALSRQTGYQHARAPYVMFLDSDDFFDSRACELALTEMLRGGHELVGMNATHWDDDGNNLPWFLPQTDTSIPSLIRSAPAAFWNYLYARRLLEGEEIFVPMYFEDAAVTPRIIAKAKSVGWLPKMWQHFYAARSGSIMSTFTNDKKKGDYFKADDILWKYAAGPYQADFAWRIAKRMAVAMGKFPELYVEGVEHTQKLYPQVKPHLTPEFPEDLRAVLEHAMTLPAQPRIPLTVYVDGFRAAQRGLNTYITEMQQGGVAQQVIVLDETSCDASSAPACLQDDPARLALWFALEGIRKTGGIFAAPGVHLLQPVGLVRYHEVFFCAGMKQTVSTRFFGGQAGQPWLQRALDTLAQGGDPAEALGALLLTEGGVHLLGEAEEGIGGLQILDRVACEIRTEKSACYLDYAGLAAPEGCMVIPTATYERMLTLQEDHESEVVTKLRAQREDFRKARDQFHHDMLVYYGHTPRGFLGRVKRKIFRMIGRQ